jgi:hypothetical protein
LPTLWIRDRAGRWHATRDYAPRQLGDNGEVTLEPAIAPPLQAGTPWIDVVAAGQSAEVRARLPLLQAESGRLSAPCWAVEAARSAARQGIALSVESGVIRRRPDSPCNFT